MDKRDVACSFSPVLKNLDRRRMVAEFTDANDEIHEVKLKFEVCDLCNGKGTHVNPSIDSHGLSREDFDEDPDFAEDYMRGVYDVSCNLCHGERVVPAIDEARNSAELVKMVQDSEQEEWAYARECAREREMGY